MEFLSEKRGAGGCVQPHTLSPLSKIDPSYPANSLAHKIYTSIMIMQNMLRICEERKDLFIKKSISIVNQPKCSFCKLLQAQIQLEEIFRDVRKYSNILINRNMFETLFSLFLSFLTHGLCNILIPADLNFFSIFVS